MSGDQPIESRSGSNAHCAGVPCSGLLRFEERELHEARAHAMAGGQALHMMSGRYAYLRPDTPNCFKGRGQIAHLFDQSIPRLAATAKKLGVRVIKIERASTPSQHIDLCGKPLARALALCPNNNVSDVGARKS